MTSICPWVISQAIYVLIPLSSSRGLCEKFQPVASFERTHANYPCS